MVTKRLDLDDDKLLELIQNTVRDWKKAEDEFLNQYDMHSTEDQRYLRAEELKDLYQSLIREAKEREITLSNEQLINKIVYTLSDKNNSNKL